MNLSEIVKYPFADYSYKVDDLYFITKIDRKDVEAFINENNEKVQYWIQKYFPNSYYVCIKTADMPFKKEGEGIWVIKYDYILKNTLMSKGFAEDLQRFVGQVNYFGVDINENDLIMTSEHLFRKYNVLIKLPRFKGKAKIIDLQNNDYYINNKKKKHFFHVLLKFEEPVNWELYYFRFVER